MTKVVRVVEDLVELDEIFDENKRKENKPVIIEFTSSVCDPCQFIGPVYTEFAEKYGKCLLFLKVG
jgi:thiol-disulfide isomerase/thioredoxin